MDDNAIDMKEFYRRVALGSKITVGSIDYVVDDITDRDGVRTIHATARYDESFDITVTHAVLIRVWCWMTGRSRSPGTC